MRILIVNDDGIKAPGIRKLAELSMQLGEVWVVASKTQALPLHNLPEFRPHYRHARHLHHSIQVSLQYLQIRKFSVTSRCTGSMVPQPTPRQAA